MTTETIPQNDEEKSELFVAVATTFHKTKLFGWVPDCVIYERPDGYFIVDVMLGDSPDDEVPYRARLGSNGIENLVTATTAVFERVDQLCVNLSWKKTIG